MKKALLILAFILSPILSHAGAQIIGSATGSGGGVTIGGTVTGGTANRIPFVNSAGTTLTDSTNLTFESNKLTVLDFSAAGTSYFTGLVGIGDTVPTEQLEIRATGTTYALRVSTDNASAPVALGVTNAGVVVVGTSTAAGQFHVAKSPLTLPSLDTDTVGVFSRNGEARLSILSANNQTGYLDFGDPQAQDAAYVAYNHSDETMRFGVGNGVGGTAERITVANGNTTFAFGNQSAPLNITYDAGNNTGSINFSQAGGDTAGIVVSPTTSNIVLEYGGVSTLGVTASSATVTGNLVVSGNSLVDTYSSSFGPVTAGSTSTVTWTEVIDRNTEFVTSSFTATNSGYYEINLHSGVSQTAGTGCLHIKKNGTQIAGGLVCNQGVTGLASVLDVSITRILLLAANDIIRVDASATTADATFQKMSFTVKEQP